ncbi:MAG: outer membrane lipoprotein-sorting protein [Nitrospirae bacterium]|nr:outer membrane lipoprotein-sorting protein [Nitrospirota bacterium]
MRTLGTVMSIGLVGVSALVLLATGPIRSGASILAADIVQKSEDVYPGKDQTARLTFTIKESKESGGAERKSVLRRYWKNYRGQSGMDFKVLVFNEYPPDAKGSSFMLWGYDPRSGKPADRWLYIPILNKVNKLVNTVTDTGIASSDLQPGDMVSRPVERDDHRLIGEEVVGNRTYYVIESTPKGRDPSYPYGKLVKWITKDTFLKERIDYYDLQGKLLKTQVTTWKPIKDAWVWEKVVITNAQTGAETYLSINDIRTNIGLEDSFFTERSMKQGLDRLP